MSLLIFCSKCVQDQFQPFQFEDVGSNLRDQNLQIQSKVKTRCFPLMSPMFGLMSYTRISRSPSQLKRSGSVNSKHNSTFQSRQRKSPPNVRNPSITSSEPLSHPKNDPKPFRGHGLLCRPRPPWPLQRSAGRPRRHARSLHAAACGLMRRRRGSGGCRGKTKA